MSRRVLIARMDNAGDVLLSGPAVRAVAEQGAEVVFLSGRRGAAAAGLLPGVREVLVHDAAWIDADPAPLDRDDTLAFVERLRAAGLDEAVVLTSFHQSPLPLALLLRLAGVPRIGAISVDYPGSLLDVRHHVDDDVHEVIRALSLVGAMGYRAPAGGTELAVVIPAGTELPPELAALAGAPFVVVHPGASVPARAWDPDRLRQLVATLSGAGRASVVTGGPEEAALTAWVSAGADSAGAPSVDLGGRTGLATLAAVLAAASAVVVGNTGPAHLAAAVGCPVVCLYAPTVPAVRWRPWAVPHVLLGDQDIVCAGCRSRQCPRPGQPCLSSVEPADVVAALATLGAAGPERRGSVPCEVGAR